MAELFMECEEEELQPWQRKRKGIVVDDDDDELIFVGEIVSAKTASTNNVNRVNPGSSPRGMQNGSPGRGTIPTFKSSSPQYKTLHTNAGTMAVSPVYQATERPTTSSVAVQPVARQSSVSGSTQSIQRPIQGGLSPQQTCRPISVSQPISRPVTIPVTSQPMSRNASIPVPPSGPRPVATVTAQPVMANQGYILSSPQITQNNSPGTMFGVQQKEIKQYPSGPTLSLTANASMKENPFVNKRPATNEVNLVPPKMSKPIEAVMGSNSPTTLPAMKLGTPQSTLPSPKGSSAVTSHLKNGTPFPRACPKCNIHFNLLDPLRNHMKYCCPDMMNAFFAGVVKTEIPSSPRYEEGKLIMLVSDFYYGKHDGDLDLLKQEQKTHTTFKCFSCAKVLKNNVRFMNHMKHHLELEKQNSESWESHTTCHHCYRQFPTPFQLQCHIESSHTLYESTTICKICELSYENEQVLLQHMKDNHKPGEMPYVCQVCSYRSSLFSDVESHFRSVHENTKALLCPFCLKVIRIGTSYMQHYMRHQKKGIYRCAKCRLQFLTSKEKIDHRTQHHRTFKKPKQLEGLPPGTKVTIRATIGSLHAESSTTSSESVTSSPAFENSTMKNTNSKTQTATVKSNASKSQPSAKPPPGPSNAKPPPGASSAKPPPGAGSGKPPPITVQSKTQPSPSQLKSQPAPLKKHNSSTSLKKMKIPNTSLKNLRNQFGPQKCIECYSVVKDFASHFPAYVNCSLCKYSTSCGKAYANHMVSFHSNRPSKRFSIFKKQTKERRSLTSVCLNCDFLTGDNGLDAMAKHMSEHPHSCQIVVESDSEARLQKLSADDTAALSTQTPADLPNLNDVTGRELAGSSNRILRSKNDSSGKRLLNSEDNSKLELNKGSRDSVEAPDPESKKEQVATIEDKPGCSETHISTGTVEKSEGSGTLLKNKQCDIEVSQTRCSKGLPSEKAPFSNAAEQDDQVIDDPQKELVCNKTDKPMHQFTETTVSRDQMKEAELTEVNFVDDEKMTKLPSGDVTFEQFLRRDEPDPVSSDTSDQGSAHLEPLTPSEVLEYEATEILQKGSISPSAEKAELSSEQTDDIPVENSPSKADRTISPKEESDAS
ncbi:zinc finger protein 280D isoform X1 [Ambystoma mexicanum]